MEGFLALSLIVGILIVLFLPIKPSQRSNPRKKYRGAGAVLFAINEVFSPSAANASVVVEEQRESRRANPSPEDKPN